MCSYEEAIMPIQFGSPISQTTQKPKEIMPLERNKMMINENLVLQLQAYGLLVYKNS